MKLLKEHKNPKGKGSKRVFLTNTCKPYKDNPSKTNLPLVQTSVVNGRMTKVDAVRSAFARIQKKTGINGGR